jgi:lipopolysaccharide export system protein LptA
MKRSEAAKYARWSAATAGVLAVVTVGVYIRHRWVAHVERKNAPPAAPVDVERQSNGLTFSKVDGNRTIFTVEASKSTEFKDQDASLLQEVKITIFGKTGERHDVIHTQSCQYSKASGGIVCSGEVQMDLQSAADAERAQKNPKQSAQIVHVTTKGINFDRAAGVAKTNEQVQFEFPGGSGSALGTEYNTEQGTLQLLRKVRLAFQQFPGESSNPRAKKPLVSDEVLVNGEKLDFGRDTRTLHLDGPASAQSKGELLTAGEFILLLDADFHPEKFHATTHPLLKLPGTAKAGPISIASDDMTAEVSPQGWLKNALASGNVHGLESGTGENYDMIAQSAALDLWPEKNQPKALLLRGKVVVHTTSAKAGENRTMRTEAMNIAFSEPIGEQGGKPQMAETLEPGSVEWVQVDAKGGIASQANLQANRLKMEFGPQGNAQLLLANGDVQTQRTMPGRPTQKATAQNGSAQLVAGGGWSQMELNGDVSLREPDRNAHADNAVFRHAEQTAVLTGKAMVRDATTETRAPIITFAQATGDIRAEGGVRSTDFSPKGSAVQFAPVPANITSASMQGNSKTGTALYTGNARLWQGDSVLEADAIELLKASRVMNATGNVRGVFPQAAAQSSPQGTVVRASTRKANLWHVTSGILIYHDLEDRAHLEKNVVVQSTEQKMRAPIVDIFFAHSGAASPAGQTATGAVNPVGTPADGKQISRAIGTGGVIVEESARKAVAERGEYTAADGKFVMSGGTPTIFDGTEGTTTGRQLTFFLADDTIIVDSENGSRILTKHRVEK